MECTPNPDCKYWEAGCYEDTHHDYWPKREYTTGIEKRFRELPENKSRQCRAWHDEIHATQEPPPKPARETMIRAIGKVAV